MPSAAEEFNYNPLLKRFFLTPEEKDQKETGKSIMKALYTQQMGSATDLNFFRARNVRWIELMLWAKGSQNIKEFLDYMSVSDANKAWVNIDTTQTRIAAQFVGTLVESMAKNKTYPCVNATDDGSMTEKEQRMLDALFKMEEVATIDDLQQQTGVALEPPGAYVPDDEISAKVYFELEDRLPKEIRFEKLLADLQKDINFERVVNRKSLYDLIVLNLAATKIERLAPKKYTVRKCIAANMVYNFFIADNGNCEITLIGEFYNVKVRDFRTKFGKSESNKNGLTEKEIFELAKLSTNKNVGSFNYIWNDNWAMQTTFSMNRPYDDCSILVLDAEINCGEDVFYVSKKDNYGKENITAKKNTPYQQTTKDGRIIEQPKPDDVEIIKRQKNTWMRGVYAPYGDTMLYWGRPDIIITPFTDISKPLSSYSINIPNNDGEYVPSLFERIMEPLREYQLVKLKRKQLIAQVEPDGYKIDIESARNIDLGNGDTVPWEELVRIKRQTGVELWSSKGIDPLSKEMPAISAGVHSQTISKIIELSNVANGILLEIRQLIGVPMYRDGSDVGDRTSGVLQEQQNKSSYNVTDYILNGNNQLWEETFYKVCLLHWNDIVKEEPETKEDMLNTRLEVEVRMKSTEYQKQLLENDIQRYSQVPDATGNPSITLKDAMQIREIDNYKTAMWYLATTVEKNRKKSMQESQALQEANGKIQEQSLLAKSKADEEAQQKKLAAEKDMEAFKAQEQMKLEIVKGSFMIAGKSENPTMPEWLTPILSQLVPNLTIPIAQENKQMQEGLQQQAMEEQAIAEQQMMAEESGQITNQQMQIQ